MTEDELERLKPLTEGHRPDTLKQVADRCFAMGELGKLLVRLGVMTVSGTAILGALVGVWKLLEMYAGGG